MVSSEPARLRATLSLWFVLFVIWTAANGTLAPAESGLGLGVTLMIAVLCTRAPGIWKDLFFTPARAISFLQYTAVFLREMIKSNLTVLGLVFAPKVKVRPGIVLSQTRLTSPFARLVLSNSVALTPGSLVLGMDGPNVYVHGLALSSTDTDASTQEFLGPFEPVLLRTFG